MLKEAFIFNLQLKWEKIVKLNLLKQNSSMQAQTAQYLDGKHLYEMSFYLFSGSDY